MGKKSETYNDEEILAGIRTNNRKVLEFVYRQFFPMIREYVVSNSGNEFIAWDVFQEGIFVVYSKMQKRKLELNSAFSTFFVAICKNLWLKYLRNKDNKEIVVLGMNPELLGANQDELETLAKENLLFLLIQKHMDELSPECRQVLRMVSESYSGQEIANEMGYASQAFVYNKKARCIAMILQKIKDDPDYKTNIGNENEQF